MTVLSLALVELRRYRRPLERAAIAFMLLVPTLYGGLYLWSNWDPYAKVDTIKVAVVDDDEPVTAADGSTLSAGAQMLDELEAEPVVDWTVTDAADAADGLASGDYLMVLTIPADFSAGLASIATDDPQPARVVLERDGANGFIVSVASRGAALELQERINQAATAAYLRVAFGELGTLRDGLGSAADGAGRLADGATQAHDGAQTLADGLDDAATGAGTLADGADQVADGNETIASVVDPVVDDLLPLLPPVAQATDDLTGDVADLTDAVSTGAEAIDTRASAVVDELEQLSQEHPELADDPALTDALAAARAASDQADDVAAATARVAESAARVHTAATAVDSQVPQIQAAVTGARDQVDALAAGARQVADGLAELAPALDDAHDGATRLADGTDELAEGAGELQSRLASAADQVPTFEDPDAAAAAVSGPSLVDERGVHLAPTYGAGLAPFFFGIALCVFGVVAFTVLRPVNPRGLTSRASSVRVALAGFVPVGAIGVAGGWILTGVIALGLGLDPVSWPRLLLLVALGSLAFTAVAHMLRTALGVVGSSIALVLLMLQLTSCAGIYPEQTLPPFFRAIHPVLPMTYVVDGLRIAMTGGPADRFALDVLVVSGFLVLFVALGTLVVHARRRWSLPYLRPVLGE